MAVYDFRHVWPELRFVDYSSICEYGFPTTTVQLQLRPNCNYNYPLLRECVTDEETDGLCHCFPSFFDCVSLSSFSIKGASLQQNGQFIYFRLMLYPLLVHRKDHDQSMGVVHKS